jgi:DNA topoisomerase-1
VWICPIPSGHVQATARDARGRKQYRYHPRRREVRDAAKYDRAPRCASRSRSSRSKGAIGRRLALLAACAP